MTYNPESETMYRGSANRWAHVSAGGILLRFANKTFEVLLLRENDEVDGWNFPRGTMSDEGNILMTAIREVEEETGYASQVIAYLGAVPSTYAVDGTSIDKITLYHILAPISQTSQYLEEHQSSQWVSLDSVAALLRKQTRREVEHEIWQKFLQWLQRQDQLVIQNKLTSIWQG